MIRCTVCHTRRNPALDTHAGVLNYGFLYGLVMNCRECSGSYLLVLYREPDDEELLVAGELSSLSHARDSREEAA